MKKQNGFTLIELVIVIIILGILAAVAVPKFVDLQSDARDSALSGVKAALESGATLTYSKAAIEGVEKTGDSVEINGTPVDIVAGYPDATSGGILTVVELDSADWGTTENDDGFFVFAAGTSFAAGTCNVQYALGTSLARPSITVNTGC